MTTPTPPAAPIAHKLGDGYLRLGEAGTLSDWSAQVTAVSVEPSVDAEDDVNVLTGGKLSGDRTYGAGLKATVLQDLSMTGLVAWSWQHRGEEVDVEFVPSATAGSVVNGRVIVDPIMLGGDVKKKNTSDVELTFVDFPTITAAAGT